MRREIRVVDPERQIVQWTFADERWYVRTVNRASGDEPVIDFVPSTTWISSHYPKGREFYRWLASHGLSEAEEIRAAAGEKGSKFHQAAHRLVTGGTVLMDDCFENPNTNAPEPLSPEEYFCLMTFTEWFEKTRPQVLAAEYAVWNEQLRYAGMVDLLCRIGRSVWMIDYTVSSAIWPSKEIQVAAYKHADTAIPRSVKLGILQVGYKKNRVQKYKFTQIPDRFPLFLAARKIWQYETEGQKPLQREYPLSLSLSPELTLREAA